MIIYRMQASFGCLQGQTLTLDPGFTLIEAPNESGKSTWCAFLVAMLYGINTRERDKKGLPAEKTRFRPWNGGPLEGLLECDYCGKRVILRRSSEGGVPFGTFSALWAESREVVPELTGENAGETLTGVGREVFERSVLFRQGSLSVDHSQELEQRIAALLSSGEEETSWSKAEARLREWQRARRYHKKGAIPQLEEEQQNLGLRIAQLQQLGEERNRLMEELRQEEALLAEGRRREQAQNRSHRQDLEKRWAEAAAELDAAQLHRQGLGEREGPTLDEAEERMEKARIETTIHNRGRNMIVASAVGLVLSVLLLFAAWQEVIPTAIPYWIIFVLGLLVVGANFLRVYVDQRDREELFRIEDAQAERKAQREKQEQAWTDAEAREARAQERYTALTRELQTDSRQSEEFYGQEAILSRKKQAVALLDGRLQELGHLSQMEVQRDKNQRRLEKMEQEFVAIELAMRGLATAEQEIREHFSPALNARTAQTFSRLTEGAYDNVQFDRDFTAQAEEPGSTALRNAMLLSRGTLDQLYFALRLSICELILPEGAKLPLILDDALAAFDDRRAQLALSLLRELAKERQIIFFTCQSREGQLLGRASDVSRQTL